MNTKSVEDDSIRGQSFMLGQVWINAWFSTWLHYAHKGHPVRSTNEFIPKCTLQTQHPSVKNSSKITTQLRLQLQLQKYYPIIFSKPLWDIHLLIFNQPLWILHKPLAISKTCVITVSLTMTKIRTGSAAKLHHELSSNLRWVQPPLIYPRVLLPSCPNVSGSFELQSSNSSSSASSEIYFPEKIARNAGMSSVRGVLIVGKTSNAVWLNGLLWMGLWTVQI